MSSHFGGALQHGLWGAFLDPWVEWGDVGDGALAFPLDREKAPAGADLDSVNRGFGEPDAWREGSFDG